MGNMGRGFEQLAQLWEHPDFGKRISDGHLHERKPLHPGLRLAVVLRDRLTCGVCGHEPPHGSSSAEAFMEVDHLVPVAAGGTDVSTNLRTLCARCNQDKSNYFTADVRTVRPRLIVAYCLNDIDPGDDDDLWADQMVFCGYCRGRRSVDREHAAKYELSGYLEREPGWTDKRASSLAVGELPRLRRSDIRW